MGWLALLILTWRQCEGLTAGIGAEEQTPTSFLFPDLKQNVNAEFGEFMGLKYYAIMNRTNEELFNEAIKGDKEAWNILKAEAGAGDREAQYYVSCRYNASDSSLYDEGLAIYWLRKSADKGYESAIKNIQSLSKKQKMKYGIEVETEDVDFEKNHARRHLV